MNELSILMVFMLLNGQPAGQTMHLLALDPDCRTELAVVEGVNRANADRGIQFIASCERGLAVVRASDRR